MSDTIPTDSSQTSNLYPLQQLMSEFYLFRTQTPTRARQISIPLDSSEDPLIFLDFALKTLGDF